MKSTIIKTTDGGDTWFEQQGPSKEVLSDIFFLNEKTGWAIGEGIFKTINGGGFVSVKDEKEMKNKFPDQIELFQNYPNPFNQKTTIRFTLQRSAYLRLRIYNLLGQEIKTLAQGKYEAGEYKVRWDEVGLPSSMYLYSLQVGDIVKTKKLILLR